MKYKIVVATDEEYKNVIELGFSPDGVIKTGVGISNTIEALRKISKDTLLINVGYAGSNTLERGRVVSVRDSFLYHPNVKFKERGYPLGGGYDCFTSCDFVLHSEQSYPVLYDMELNAICALGFNVKSFKIISDNLSVSEYEKFDRKEAWAKIKKEILNETLQQRDSVSRTPRQGVRPDKRRHT